MRNERRKHHWFLPRILWIDLRDLFSRFMLGR